MYTTENHQHLLAECNKWHEQLQTTRDKINVMKNELYRFAPGKTSQEVLKNVEHFHNLFHIQLINVHDLKHEIRHHLFEAKAHPELGPRVEHHRIKDKLDRLLSDYDQLNKDFHQFIQ